MSMIEVLIDIASSGVHRIDSLRNMGLVNRDAQHAALVHCYQCNRCISFVTHTCPNSEGTTKAAYGLLGQCFLWFTIDFFIHTAMSTSARFPASSKTNIFYSDFLNL